MSQLIEQLLIRPGLSLAKICVFVLISCGMIYGAINSGCVFALFALLMVSVCVPNQLAHTARETVKDAFTQSFDLLLKLKIPVFSYIEKVWKKISNGQNLLQFLACKVISPALFSLFITPPIVTKFIVTAPLSNRQ